MDPSTSATRSVFKDFEVRWSPLVAFDYDPVMQPIGSQPILSIQAVDCRRAGRPILSGASLTLGPGDHRVVVAANGAGKSTLLRVAAGLVRPDAGSVRIAGVSVRRPGARRALGWSADRPILPRLTVKELLAVSGQLAGGAEGGPPGLLDELDLTGLLHRRADALSHGETRRVALALALWHAPRLLLLDEPFAGLDTGAADRVRNVLKTAMAGDRAVLLATPDPDRLRGLLAPPMRLVNGRLEGP